MPESGRKLICQNRKARHDYHILDTIEAGIALTGTEVKSLREGKANLKDAYARIDNDEAFLFNLHISPYEQGGRYNHEPTRTRKLLLHKQEITKLFGRVQMKGLTLIPLSLYFSKGRVKVELGVARGKKAFDKRDDMAERDAKREMERAVRREGGRNENA
jgi:SsrA-binding protein